MKWIALLAIATYLGFTALTLISILSHTPKGAPEQADAIVVISGANLDTKERMGKGIELYAAVDAQDFILSGGTGAAEAMRAIAFDAGIPARDVTIEPASRSTLQNALFIRDLGLAADADILLVTHRFHAPRAWASFRWAGFTNVTVLSPDASEPLEWDEDLLKEGVKWPANIARAMLGSIMMAADAPRDDWIGWLN